MRDSLSEQLNRIEDGLALLLEGQDHILCVLERLTHKEVVMSQELDDLIAKVNTTVGLEESCVALINGLAAQIAALKTDPAALQALSDQLNTEAARVQAALTANAVSVNKPKPVK